jgi:hypothetical protein
MLKYLRSRNPTEIAGLVLTIVMMIAAEALVVEMARYHHPTSTQYSHMVDGKLELVADPNEATPLERIVVFLIGTGVVIGLFTFMLREAARERSVPWKEQVAELRQLGADLSHDFNTVFGDDPIADRISRLPPELQVRIHEVQFRRF